MARRRRDRWALGPAFSLPELARGGPDYDVAPPDPVLAWLQFPDRILEVEARAIAYTERAVLGTNDKSPPRAPEGTRRGLLLSEQPS